MLPYSTNPAHVINTAQAMARAQPDARSAMVLQWVAVGCMVLMGVAAGVHIAKEIVRGEGRGRGRD